MNKYSESTEFADDPQPQAGKNNDSKSTAGDFASRRWAIGLRSAATLGTAFLIFRFRKLLSPDRTE